MERENRIFAYYYEIKENHPRRPTIVRYITSVLLNIIKESVKEAFMESADGNVCIVTEQKKDRVIFEAFLCSAFYNKHIGRLTKEQGAIEHNRLLHKVNKRMCLPRYDETITYLTRYVV